MHSLRPRRAATPRVLPAVLRAALLLAPLSLITTAGAAERRNAACTPSGVAAVEVDWAAPPGAPVSAIKVRLDYGRDDLSLPGSGASARSRFRETPGDALLVVNDLGDSVEVLVSRSGSLPAGKLLAVDFDACGSAGAAGDVACTVLDCASSFGPVKDCSCRTVRR